MGGDVGELGPENGEGVRMQDEAGRPERCLEHALGGADRAAARSGILGRQSMTSERQSPIRRSRSRGIEAAAAPDDGRKTSRNQSSASTPPASRRRAARCPSRCFVRSRSSWNLS